MGELSIHITLHNIIDFFRKVFVIGDANNPSKNTTATPLNQNEDLTKIMDISELESKSSST